MSCNSLCFPSVFDLALCKWNHRLKLQLGLLGHHSYCSVRDHCSSRSYILELFRNHRLNQYSCDLWLVQRLHIRPALRFAHNHWIRTNRSKPLHNYCHFHVHYTYFRTNPRLCNLYCPSPQQYDTLRVSAIQTFSSYTNWCRPLISYSPLESPKYIDSD